MKVKKVVENPQKETQPKLYAKYTCKHCLNEYLEEITKDKKVLIKEGYICANDRVPMVLEIITK